jgi:WD40 repeat protein/serine/threonine protein kinase
VDAALLGRKARCKQCRTRFVLAPAKEVATLPSSPWPWLSGSAWAAATGMGEGTTDKAGDGAASWKPGDVIIDLYEVREVFTSGGMGLVYRVRHRGWNVDLAVKCPRPEYFHQEQDKENFEREAETWVKLGLHPHTVACYYVRRLGGIPRVFAEYVEGGSLQEWIRTRRLYGGGPRRALERILDIAIQFTWGLQHAHEQGLVHRDVKPGNVLLTAAGVAKVTDFGMARARGVTAQPAPAEQGRSILVSAGGLTPAFCSPEQVQGQPVSRKTDVWSWAVSVLEMFTGAATWSAGYLAPGVLEDYLRQGPDDPRLPAMPAALADLLQRCFRMDPEQRPQDMLEVAAVLRSVYEEVTGGSYARTAPAAAEALADSLNNRAVSLLDLKKQDDAERLWEQALAADPHHPESTYNLGLSRLRGGRTSAEAVLSKLQEVCASHAGGWLPPYLLAQVHLERGNWQAAREALEQISGPGARLEEVRTALGVAEDRLRGRRRQVRVYHGHADWVSSVALSRDGRLALSGSADRTLRLWEVATGQCVRVLPGHTEWVTCVSLSGDGARALSGSADQTLRLWDVAAGRCLHQWGGHGKWVLAACLSADEQLALSGGGDGLLKLWDVATGKHVRDFAGHLGPALSVALSADSRLALSGSRDGTLKLWDVTDGECRRTLQGHADRVLSVCLSADGRLALSGGGDRTVRLWDLESGQCLRIWEGHAGAVFAVCLSPDGRCAVSASGDRTLRVWRLAGEGCLATLSGHAGTVHSVCLSGDGRYALSGSGDCTLTLWSLPRDRPAPYFVSRVLPSETALAAWADYEKALARADQATAAGDALAAARWLREARAQPGSARRPAAMNQWAGLYVRLPRRALGGGWEGHTLEGHLDAVTCLAVSDDGRHALSGSADRTLRLWELSTGQCLRTLEAPGAAITSVCLGAHQALSGTSDGTVQRWDVASGRCLAAWEGHADVAASVALSGDGRWAVSGGADGALLFWEVATGRLLHNFGQHTDPIHSVALTADGRGVLSGAAQFLIRGGSERLFTSGQLRLWDTATGRCTRNFAGAGEGVTAVCLSPDGRLALSGSGQAFFGQQGGLAPPAQLHLWEVATGRRLVSFAGHPGAVTSVCLSGDGRYALSGGTDGRVRLWEAATGQSLRTFAGHTDAVTAVALTPDGRYALSAGADRLVKVWVLDWDLEETEPADWDEGARPHLEMFLARHTPCVAPLPPPQKRSLRALMHRSLGSLFRRSPTDEALVAALTRRGRPEWTDEDFEELLFTLGCAGYGWLRPAGVRRRLEQLARAWDGPPRL